MKRSVCFVTAFCLLVALTACAVPPSPDADSEILQNTYASADREADMIEISDFYQNVLTEEARQTVLEENLNTVSIEVYQRDPKKAFAALHKDFQNKLYFRSEGSLTAPVAPESAEEAKSMIRKEFSSLAEEKYLTLADEMIDSGSAAGEQDNILYEENPQESFDGARRMILSQALHWIADAA